MIWTAVDDHGHRETSELPFPECVAHFAKSWSDRLHDEIRDRWATSRHVRVTSPDSEQSATFSVDYVPDGPRPA